MKTKYPIIGVIIALILLIALESTYFPMQDTIMGILLVLLFSCIGATVYCLIKSVIRKDHIKSQQNRKLQNIDRALDEIETTLDAMTQAGQEDGKITPIWGAGTKKDR